MPMGLVANLLAIDKDGKMEIGAQPVRGLRTGMPPAVPGRNPELNPEPDHA